ncbi:MAG: twin-arginine translocase TatA/TatE family subunit [Sphingobacteriaceae bacterium]|nr:MAG: twin-arginine translocase TatA/TatE family subunit [Sphingobacteriaceae bacterium]
MLHSVYLFLNIGTPELMLILFVALLLFGGDKLPGMARTLGRGIRDFKDASEDVKREIHKQINTFDEKEERQKHQPAIDEEPHDRYATNKTNDSDATEEPAATVISQETENLNDSNNVDAVTPADTETPASETEVKKPDFTRPANTVEYKG